ncbi:MAG: hypothetical protein JST32_09010 [Bacteroidetes bacterium]|nr:hypothetical protein [Bacteroidota bacterium]
MKKVIMRIIQNNNFSCTNFFSDGEFLTHGLKGIYDERDYKNVLSLKNIGVFTQSAYVTLPKMRKLDA